MCDSFMSSNYFNNSSSNNNNNNQVSSTGVFPSITDFAGDENFEIILSEADSIKKKWLFSEKLRKVFIDIHKTIGIQFRWFENKLESPSPRFIRALPVYTQDDWLRIPVERCPVHKCYEEQFNSEIPSVNHVLRCENEGTVYEVDKNSFRRSCITPITVPGNGNDVVTLFYKFVCKTSCYRGMQRRPVVVIFTLEDVFGTVLGRRCLSFKVCSCLKRDLHREESGLRRRKNRKLTTQSPDEYTSMSTNFPSLSHLPRNNMNSHETIIPCSLRLLRLKKDYAIFALTVLHNTLLGEYIRNNVEGTEVLISQVEKYLSKFYQTRLPSAMPPGNLLDSRNSEMLSAQPSISSRYLRKRQSH